MSLTETLTEAVAEPPHVCAAPSHPDPFPYYARLAVGRPIFRDPQLDCWVAANAAAVREVLENAHCHTRPATQRVPDAIAAGRMGELFGWLVRQNDGERHASMKPAVTAAVRGVDLTLAARLAHARADALEAASGALDSPAAVTRFLFALPTHVMAQLLGVGPDRFDDVVAWLGDYGAATASIVTGTPAPSDALTARGHAGAGRLLDLMAELRARSGGPGPLLTALAAGAEAAGCSEAAIIANAAGLLVQGHGAIASVAGSTLLALARRPDLQARVAADPAALRPVMQEVLRTDPSTNSTLRFVAQDTVIAGQPLAAGDRIVVMLAVASRDPALNPEPNRFDPDRADRRMLEFGAGRHACPADRLAPLLAEVAVARVLAAGFPLDRLAAGLSYAASAHIRTPRFA